MGDEEPRDNIADYEEVDEGLSGEVSNYNEEEVEYVDFLSVEDILNSPNNDVDEFYTDGENYMFIREVTIDPFLSIFIACGREKEREKYCKSKVLSSGEWDFHDRHQGILMIRSVTLIFKCCLVLILRKGKWNELTAHLKDRGKDRSNSRLNSLQHGENDADQIECRSLFFTTLDLVIERPLVLDRTHDNDRSCKFNGFLLERPLKAISCMTERPPALDRTHDCAQAHEELYVNFLHFKLLNQLYFLVLVVFGF